MPLFHIAVLMRFPRLDVLAREAIVRQQFLIAAGEGLAPLQGLHRRREAVGAMALGHPAQLPEGRLQPGGEALEALREADRPRFPVGVGEDEVIEEVVERLPGERHRERREVAEVGGRQLPGRMLLGKEDLLVRAFERPPGLQLALEGAQLPGGELPRILALEVGEQGLGLQPRMDGEHGA